MYVHAQRYAIMIHIVFGTGQFTARHAPLQQPVARHPQRTSASKTIAAQPGCIARRELRLPIRHGLCSYVCASGALDRLHTAALIRCTRI